MQINKKDTIRFKKGLKVVFTEHGWLLSYEQQKINIENDALLLLRIFSEWLSIEEGTKKISEKCSNKEDFLRLNNQFLKLLRANFFELKDENKNFFSFHNGKFDSFPVHIRMLNDKSRTKAFQKAIRETVSENDIVLDIGTGNGVLAATAALCGAKHVYAIERTEFIEVARAIFKANGLEDKITLIQGNSNSIELPQKATVLVSEIIGNDPFDEGILKTFHDAKSRLLVENAKIIPSNITLLAAAVQCDDKKYNNTFLSAQNFQNWKAWYGINFEAMNSFFKKDETKKLKVNTADTKKWEILAEPIEVCHVNFSDNEFTVAKKTIPLTIGKEGNFNGIILFFETKLSSNSTLSLHPNKVAESNHWVSQLFLKTEEKVQSGDQFELNYELKNLKSQINISKKSKTN